MQEKLLEGLNIFFKDKKSLPEDAVRTSHSGKCMLVSYGWEYLVGCV